MTNNTTLTEIAALVLAALLMAAGTILLYTGKITYDAAIFFFISALGLFGFNSAWKAPSPLQQSQLMNMVSQQTAQPPVVINNNIPAPVSLPAPVAQPIAMQAGNTYPYPAVQAPPIESMPTQGNLQAVRTNTPAQGG
jgi:hypothetical protein